MSLELCCYSTGFDFKICLRTRKVIGPSEKRVPGSRFSRIPVTFRPVIKYSNQNINNKSAGHIWKKISPFVLLTASFTIITAKLLKKNNLECKQNSFPGPLITRTFQKWAPERKTGKNTPHILQRRRDWNPGHIGGRCALTTTTSLFP